MRDRNFIPAFAVVLMVLGASGASLAEERKDDGAAEAAALQGSKVTLAQAIAVAEQATGAKALDAGIDNENGTNFIVVGVMKDDQPHKVLIDLQTGAVAKVVADSNDGDGEGEGNN